MEDEHHHVATTTVPAMTFAQLMELAMMTAKTAMTTAKTVASISATVGRLKEATTKNVTSIDSLVELTEENAASRDLLAAPLDALLANIEREDIEEGARTTPLVVASCTPSAVAGNLQRAPATPHDVASTQLLAVVYNIQLACAPPLVGASSLPSTVGGNLPKMDDPTHPPKPTPMSYVGTVLSEMGGDCPPVSLVPSATSAPQLAAIGIQTKKAHNSQPPRHRTGCRHQPRAPDHHNEAPPSSLLPMLGGLL